MKTFGYFPKNSALEEFISMIWELEGKQNCTELILPSGIMEIVFNLSDPMSAVFPDGTIVDKAPRCFIQGIHTSVIEVNYTERHHLFGVRLKPFAIKSLFGVLPSEISNKAIDLTLIRSDMLALWHQMVELTDFAERVGLIKKYFQPLNLKKCHRTEMLSNLFFEDGSRAFRHQHTSETMMKHGVFENVTKLAREVCYSSRHLNRKSKELFGLSAEELVRYKKFLHAVELIHADKFSLTEIAHMSGFFDQPHFIRTFKSYANMTPKMYQTQKGSLPFHLIS